MNSPQGFRPSMIYTCYEMIQDCRAGRPEGLAYLVTHYVPFIRKVAAHYSPADSRLVEKAVQSIPQSDLFAALEPAPERWFLARLRQHIVALVERRAPAIDLDLESVAKALEPLTVVEKQAAWMETMRYPAEQAGTMLRMAPATVQKIRDRASELVRGSVDAWHQGILAESGFSLGQAAAAHSTGDCLTPKAFLDVLDGRNTWRDREDMERHVTGCWHCVDHFCRIAEVIELVRGMQPLSDSEAAPYLKILGVTAEKKSGWKKLFGR